MKHKSKTSATPKTIRIFVRVSNDMYDMIRYNAEHAHMSMAEYIRQIVSGKRPIIHQEIIVNHPELLDIFKDLSPIGDRLNNIARYLNQGGELTGQMMDVVMQSIADLRAMGNQVSELHEKYDQILK